MGTKAPPDKKRKRLLGTKMARTAIARPRTDDRSAAYGEACALMARFLSRAGRELRCVTTRAGDWAWAQALAAALPKASLRICGFEPVARVHASAKRRAQALSRQYGKRVRIDLHPRPCALEDLPVIAASLQMEAPDVLHVTISTMEELDAPLPRGWPMRGGFLAVTFDHHGIRRSGEGRHALLRIAKGGLVFGVRFSGARGQELVARGMLADFQERVARGSGGLKFLATSSYVVGRGGSDQLEDHAIFQRVN